MCVECVTLLLKQNDFREGGREGEIKDAKNEQFFI